MTTEAQSPLLSASHLDVQINKKQILREASFSLLAGELVGIIGSNGAGKSTLLKSLIGVHPLHAGSVEIGGKPLASFPPRERARRIAYLAQDHGAHWPMQAQDVVALGRIPHAHEPSKCQELVAHYMQVTQITHLHGRNVQTLSGGERARVLLARALTVEAPILLADEPLSALDPAHQIRILELLQKQAERACAVAVVLHDLALATRYCSRLVLMHEGRVIASGSPEAVCSDQNLAHSFGIVAQRCELDGQRVTIPWALSKI